MTYIFKQQLNLRDLADLESQPKRILIYEPESYLAALYCHYLNKHNFDIKHCSNLAEVGRSIKDFQPHLLIFSADGDSFKSPGMISSLSRAFPGLQLLTTGYNLSSQSIKTLMDAGVLGHLNRRLSRPQDIVEIVKTLL
jgi:DNA-binding NtrC family response regulator